MSGWIIFFAASMIEVAAAIYFYVSFLEIRMPRRSTRIAAYIILYLIEVVNAVFIEAFSSGFYPLKLVMLILVHILFIRICYRTDWIVCAFLGCFVNMLQVLIEMEIGGIFKMSYHGTNHYLISSAAVVSNMFLFALIYYLHKKLTDFRRFVSESTDRFKKFIWLPFFSVIAGLYFYLMFMSKPIESLEMIVSATLIAGNIAALFIMQELMLKDEKLRLSELQIENKQNQLQAFKNMQSLYERQGRKLHDYKKQLSTVQELLKNGDVKTAIDYIGELTKSISVEASELNVGHPVINAVLNQQYRVAKEKNIGMTFAVGDLHEIMINDDDVVIVLGNLLENAIHECEKLVANGRDVSVSVKFIVKAGHIILTVRNPVLDKVNIMGNKVLKPSQDGHGIGLSNVEEVVERYGGSLAISCDEQEFIAALMI